MSFKFDVPTKLIFGPGSISKLRKEKMPGKKALLVISNGKSTKANGSLDKVKEELKAAGVEMILYDKVEANPLQDTIMKGAELAKKEGCDFVVGLGGGSVLDATKVIAAMAVNKGVVWDYMATGTGKGEKLTKRPLPCIAITTTAGTGSEVDAFGVVSNPDTNEKIGLVCDCPILAIVDPELMVTVPAKFTAYQGFDALFHCIEGYISKFSNEMGDMVDLTAISHIAGYLPRAVKDGTDMEARTKVAMANTLGGYSMDVSTCTSEHGLEHAMSGHHQNLPHGAGLIMISLAYFRHFIDHHVCDDRFVDMARAMGRRNASDPEEFLEALWDLQKACDVDDLKMSDYGFTKGEIPGLVTTAQESMSRLFLCDRIQLSDDDCRKIYEESFK